MFDHGSFFAGKEPSFGAKSKPSRKRTSTIDNKGVGVECKILSERRQSLRDAASHVSPPSQHPKSQALLSRRQESDIDDMVWILTPFPSRARLALALSEVSFSSKF